MRVSAATVDITPPAPCQLAGFSGRHGPFQGISSPLEANAMAIRVSPDRRCAILLTLDSLFVGAALQSILADHFQRVHGQNPDDLLVLASHTHFAPSLDESKPALGTVDPAYCAYVAERCRSLLDRLLAEPGQPAKIARRKGSSTAGINRRRPWRIPHLYGRRFAGLQDVMAPNPRGPMDPTITALSVTDEADRPIALIWHYACHPTGFPQQLHVSADFPGTARALLRSRYGEGLPVLFLQGFAGDIRPRIPETRSLARRALRCLVWGPSFDNFTPEQWHGWSAGLADDVLRTFASRPVQPAASDAAIRSASKDVPISQLLTGQQDERHMRFQRLQVATLCDIVAVPAEPLMGLRPFIPFEHAIAVGYLGDAFGYWPTDRDAAQGGYEVNFFLSPFGLNGRLRKSLDPVFRDAVDALNQLL